MTEPDVAAGPRRGGEQSVAACRLGLYAIAFLADLGAGTYSFAVARILAEKHGNVSVAAWSGAAMMTGYGLTAYLAGKSSDRIDRRILLLAAGVLGTAISCAAPFVDTPASHYLLMALLGMAAAMVYPTTIGALTATCSATESHAVLFKFTVCWNVGLMAGAAAAGHLLAANALNGAFLLTGASMACVAATALILRFPHIAIGETAEQEDDSTPAPPLTVRRRFAIAGWCGLASATFIVGLVQFVFPSMAAELGIEPELHGLMLAVYRFMSIFVYICLRLTGRWQYRLSWLIGAEVFGIATMLAFAYISATWAVFAVVTLSSVFPGILYLTAIYYGSNGFTRADRGKAGGIHETVIAGGFVLGLVLSGQIGDLCNSTRAPFIAGAIVIAISMVAQLVVLAPIHRSST